MKIYVLKRRKDWEADYDQHEGFVVIAKDAKAARQLVINRVTMSVDEQYKNVWGKTDRSSCRAIGDAYSETEQVILRDFREG